MDELPREARELLALVQDAHDPPDAGARSRVKHGVLLAAAAGGGAAALASKAVASAAGSAATGAAKTGLFASATAKMFLAGSAIVVASAVTVAVPRMSTPAREDTHQQASTRKARPHASAKPQQLQAPAIAPESEPMQQALEQPAVEPAAQPPVAQLGVPLIEAAGQSASERAHVVRAARARAHKSAGPSLEAEMRLLQGASDALASNDVAHARALLGEHRKTFPQGQLRAEREGLITLAACTQGGAAAQKQARVFLRKEPSAVLSARIRSACKLDE